MVYRCLSYLREETAVCLRGESEEFSPDCRAHGNVGTHDLTLWRQRAHVCAVIPCVDVRIEMNDSDWAVHLVQGAENRVDDRVISSERHEAWVLLTIQRESRSSATFASPF